MFISHIDLTLLVAMVTDNGLKCRLNRENAILDHNSQVLQTKISAQLNTKKDIFPVIFNRSW